MVIFRIEKNTNYTVMSNHHLRDKSLSLKAKGLLSQILSLPEEWDYTLQGLTCINREQLDAIRQAIHELERTGYIVWTRERDSQGQLWGKVCFYRLFLKMTLQFLLSQVKIAMKTQKRQAARYLHHLAALYK